MDEKRGSEQLQGRIDCLEREIHRLKEAEKKLKKSEQRYKRIFENLVDVYYEATLDGTILEISPSIEKLSLRNREELIGKSLYDVYADSMERDLFVERIREKGFVNDYEVTLKDKDDSLRPCSVTARLVGNDVDGSSEKLIGSIRDISIRKKAEQSLRQLKEWSEKILNTIQSGVLVIDAKSHRIIDLNRATEKMIGAGRDEIIGHICHKFVCPKAAGDCPITDRGKKLDEIETVLLRKDGSPAEILKTVNSISIDGTDILIESFIDVSVRKQAEEGLREKNAQLANFASQVPGMLYQFMKKPDGSFSVPYTSDGIKAIFGCSPEDVKNDFRPIYKAIYPEDRDKVLQAIDESEKNLSQWNCEYRVQLPGQTIKWMFGNSIPEKMADGSVIWSGYNVDITERKQTEKLLLESEEKFRMLFDSSNDGILLGDAVTKKLVMANDRICEMLGYTKEELTELSVTDIHPQDALEKVLDDFERQLGKEIRASVNIPLKRKDGTIFYADINTSPTTIGGKDYLLGTFRDITDRKMAEHALHESEARILSIIETAMDGFVLLDIDGNILEANRTYCRMSGYSEQELLGMTIADVDLMETPDEVIARIRAVIEVGQARFETKHQRKDGTPMDVECSVQYQQTDGGCLVVFVRDITAHNLKEKHNSMLVEMLDVAPNSILIHDSAGRLFYANRKAFEMHGYEKNEFMGLNLHELDVPESERLIEKRMKIIEETGEATFVVEHYKKDGSTIPMNVYVKSVEWEGKPALLSIATDISESRQAEAEKERLEAQLSQAQKMEAVGRLAGGVAHDFNNMLSLILGHAEFALNKIEPSSPLYANLEEMKMAGERSAELTRQLLAFARKQTIAPKVIDLNEILEGMLKMLQRLIGEDIELNWTPGSDLWTVKLDPGQVDQLLANLCVNARDAIADVGLVTIETKNVKVDESYSRNRMGLSSGNYVQIAVSDNGCGMDTEILENIFDPFFTTKGIGKGTGLGLSTVYGIVKQNNGFIDVYSEQGMGTTFKVYLPRYEAGEAEKIEKKENKIVEQGHETILIVEDEPAMLKMTRMMLETMGYTVLTAETPGGAIRIAREYPKNIDLLLTDVVMPEMNGRDLTREILSLYPNVKQIFMSGYTADVIAHHGILEKGVNFIPKPYSAKELGSKVREVLDAESYSSF